MNWRSLKKRRKKEGLACRDGFAQAGGKHDPYIRSFSMLIIFVIKFPTAGEQIADPIVT